MTLRKVKPEMTFTEAEEKFRYLQLRVQRGEHLSEEEYESELAKLMVQDPEGTFWSPDPETGRWLYFNGTEWVPGSPPRDSHVATIGGAILEKKAESKPPESPPESESPVPPTAPEPTLTVEPTPAPLEAPVTETVATPPVVEAADPEMPDVRKSLPLRPTRDDKFPVELPAERPWLPIALGAIGIALCMFILLFALRPIFFASAQPTLQPTTTLLAVVQPTAPLSTSTRAPTNTPPAPTATPTVGAVLGRVNADPLNVRAGPGATFSILGRLTQGAQVILTGKSEDGNYFQIQYPEPGKFGWVSKAFIDLVSGSVDSLPIVKPGVAPAAPTPAPKPTQPKPTETPAG